MLDLRPFADAFLRGNWLHRRRAMAWLRIFAALEILAFLFFVAGTHGLIVKLDKPTTTDFVSFYAAGSLANDGQAAAAYDRTAHAAAETRALGIAGTAYNYFFYPPTFLPICQLLAHLPYLAAFIVWVSATALLFTLAIRAILPKSGALLAVLAYPAIPFTIGFGQNGLLSAALFGGALLNLERRPWLAGMLFGGLCFKPHFGLLIPVALIFGRHGRAICAAAATVIAAIGLTLLLYGVSAWRSFLALSVNGTGATFMQGKVPFAGLISPFGGLRLIGVAPHAALAAQIVVAALMAALVARAWAARRQGLPTRAMILLAATQLAVPVILFYDMTLTALAIAFAWRDAARHGGFLYAEKIIIGLLFLVPMLSRGLGVSYGIPIGPLGSALLLGLALAHGKRDATAP